MDDDEGLKITEELVEKGCLNEDDDGNISLPQEFFRFYDKFSKKIADAAVAYLDKTYGGGSYTPRQFEEAIHETLSYNWVKHKMSLNNVKARRYAKVFRVFLEASMD